MCVDYDVSSKPVSFHTPLTRLLAALTPSMAKFGLNLVESSEFDIPEKLPMIELLEPTLRTTVFAAQVQAGMWRRNGYSLLDQVRTVYHRPQ